MYNPSINIYFACASTTARERVVRSAEGEEAGVRCCCSHGQGLFHHHVIVFVPFQAAARDMGSYLWMPQPKGELECIPAFTVCPSEV